MKLHYIVLSITLAVVLAGCESRSEIAQQKMNEIRNQPPVPPEPVPTFPPVSMFVYDAQNVRSPFIPYSIAQDIKQMAGRKVFPNNARIKQPLEAFPLEQLLLKGTMQQRAGLVAVIQTPDGTLETVTRGNYLGQNHGRIVRIKPANLKSGEPAQIDLVEIIPNPRGGYVERPRTLVMLGSAS